MPQTAPSSGTSVAKIRLPFSSWFTSHRSSGKAAASAAHGSRWRVLTESSVFVAWWAIATVRV
ncbi:hypothetical protein ACFU8I_03550 [Streptomyces sp. NPDC057540]|uniref:hypothetical protein n=1 Tax=Streptomyces sp. NPDC057540 TaxID=3346160 RepID=UPI00368ED71A